MGRLLIKQARRDCIKRSIILVSSHKLMQCPNSSSHMSTPGVGKRSQNYSSDKMRRLTLECI